MSSLPGLLISAVTGDGSGYTTRLDSCGTLLRSFGFPECYRKSGAHEKVQDLGWVVALYAYLHPSPGVVA